YKPMITRTIVPTMEGPPDADCIGNLLLALRLLHLSQRLGNRRGNVLPHRVDALERDLAVEFPFVLRTVNADVVNARADDEADHVAAIVERAAVAGVDRGVDAIRSRDEIERRHRESHARFPLQHLRRVTLEIRV